MNSTMPTNNQHPNLLGAGQVQREGLSGVIRHLLYDRGFGFVEGTDGFDYFFHWTGLNRKSKHFRNLKEGEKVTFDIEDDTQNRGFRIRSNSLVVVE